MISLIIPCHNEESVLPAVYDRITAAAADWHDDWEVLLVDDGSRDRTWDHIVELHERDARWKGIALTRNFGQQAAIGAGLEEATGDAIVILDADLQDPPETIWRMIEKWHEGFDIVHGVRQQRPEAWWKRAAYAGFYRLLAHCSSVQAPLDAGDFGLMDRRVVEVLLTCKEQHPFWRGLRAWTGFRHIGVPYRRPARLLGESQYSLKKLCKLALDGWLCLAPSPLRIFLWLGGFVLVAVLALGLACASGVTGAALMTWLALLLGALQLVGIGALGTYLGRLHDELRGRPRWIVADTVGIRQQTRGLRVHQPAA